MKKIFFISTLFISSLFFQSCSVKHLISQPTSLETIMAVKEVLSSSYFKAFKTIGTKGVNGLIPTELDAVLKTMNTLGFGIEVDSVKKVIDKSSKLVYSEGKGIMSEAIKQVNLGDAVSIVIGGEDAATAVLRKAMYQTVKNKYSSMISMELDKADINQYWPLAAGAYNTFAKNKVDSNLSDFIAERAVDGVFLAMGKEEKKIRKNPNELGKALVSKVFSYYKNKSNN